ncbi:MAG TPA: SIMPL domain-containing protein [Candidatus Limnocylindrales bacterium]
MNDKPSNAKQEVEPASGAIEASRHAGPVTMGRAIAVTAAASLLLGIIVGPIISGHPTLAVDPTSPATEHTVTVFGSGQVSVAPDVADVVLGVSITKSTVAEAQSAAATSMASVVAALKKDGVDTKDIVTVNLSLSPVYDYNNNGSAPRLVGQQYANTVRVTVRDLKNVAAVVDDTVAAGATTIQGISFRLDDPKTVQSQARQLAMNDALAKATALTAAANVSVKGVASISETSTTPIIYNGATLDSKAAAAQVATPIQTGTTDVVITVTVTYLIG